MSKLIYIADDEDNIRYLVKTFLENTGYEVEDFNNGELLLEKFQIKPCDMVILDVMMPGSDGFEICKKIREESIVPIIMLTARDTDIDYITGITLGSDDYFTKPFSPMSLVMRVKAIFRRIEFEHNINIEKNIPISELKFGNITINLHNKIVTFKDENLDLTPNEYNLLKYLFENCERAVSREELLDKIWGYDSEVETRAADDTVKRLRKKISHTDVSIETVWGFGFRLKDK
ncbi:MULTISPECIES: response regulator transcription factor [Clostridium]|uniref:Stage 0 sporulation protein A homolog n=2 Tax=Clostridium butyricum TaxID=1492 RepID=C4IJ78_CLOBU|nr:MULTISPECIES: response regulator transcription factor [Clostridium]ALP90052.1 two-component system response regulator [Clostridium butyricum]ALS16505.1 two-component system response regulator [Clostridium butyricum]ANF13669.1 DNA-binding response regulator [Clostridium butyricum]AOR93736.1 DNA-binding response regulator [Clostridium butyricum]AXB84361.1 DNA-binding response regulator [Clostridium butyricum]